MKQYEFSIKIDEYIFNRFVKNKSTIQDFKTHKKKYPKAKCNFILKDNNEIYLWDISERVALGELT
jgi:hypothetical protein